MGRIDENIEKIKDLQSEIDHRTEIEMQAEKLICEGKFEEARELLNSLNDELVRELAEGVGDEDVDSNNKHKKEIGTKNYLTDRDLYCLAIILQGYEYLDGDTFSGCKYCMYHEDCDSAASKGYVYFTKTVKGKLQDITGVYLGLNTHDIRGKIQTTPHITSIHENTQ